MDASPLTRQPQPEVFTPKVVQLYAAVFKDEDEFEKSEGFWKEFFLLRPDRPTLKSLLDALRPTDVLLLEHQTRDLFRRAITTIRRGHGNARLHALDVRGASFPRGSAF
jgi:hypothetical protein